MTVGESRIVRVVGCGRSTRRDDTVGLRIARAVARQLLPHTECIATEAPALDLIDDLECVDLLIIVDSAAAAPGVAPGAWTRIDYGRSPERLRQHGGPDAHTFGAESALRLADALGTLPPRVVIYAIAAGSVDYGENLTPAVEQIIPVIVSRIRAEIESWLRQRENAHA